jgi:photosystem II stability/assembly factor-like uncharacterized protein
MMKMRPTTTIPHMFTACLLLSVLVEVYPQGTGQWEILNNGITGSLANIKFINENVGWVTGHSPPWSSENTLSRTEDGGDHWIAIELPQNIDFRSIDMTGDATGWAFVRQNGTKGVYKTIDGGQNWQSSYAPPQSQDEPFGYHLFALNDSIVYLAGYYYAGGVQNFISHTTDAGNNWTEISLGLQNRKLYEVTVYNHDLAVVSGVRTDTWQVCVLRTHDGGDNWDEIIIPSFGYISDLQFINDSTLYFLADEYFLCATTDTLNTWTIKTQTTDRIRSYSILNAQSIFAVMDDSLLTKVMKSTDGGESWEIKRGFRIRRGGRYGSVYIDVLGKIYFKQDNVGFILSEAWGVMKTTDDGENWSLHSFAYPLNDVAFIDSYHGFACGGIEGGMHAEVVWGDLFYTDDGGITWYPYFDMRGLFRTCYFVNQTVGFMLSGEVIYKSIASS